jgi:transposase
LTVRERGLFNLTEKMFFFDLTNTYFEGAALANPKAKYGRSKEKRSDCKLVTLGLIVDEMGFSKATRVFEGNKSEPSALGAMIEELESSIGKRREGGVWPTIVIDAGIATEDNLAYLKKNNYHYLAVNRGKTPFALEESDPTIVRNDPARGGKVTITRVHQENEVYVVCRSEKKKGKEAGIRGRVEDLFLERLAYSREGLGKKNRPKKYRKVVEIVGRLKEKYPKAAKLYEVTVTPEAGKRADDPTLVAIDIVWTKKESYDNETSAEGCYVLRTDRFDLSDSEIWETYVMLTRIEYAFRCMKSSLGLRPNFHQKERRVDAHLFISVLAYHILNIAEHRLRAAGIHSSWATVRDVMRTHERITISFNMKDEQGEIRNQLLRLNSRLTADQLEIYRALKLSPLPLPRKKLSPKGVVTTLFDNS